MLRAVLDTTVLVAGLRSRSGASFRLLELVATRRVRPLLTIALFLEYDWVLLRPEQLGQHGFPVADIHALLAEFAALAEPVDVHLLWRPQLGDPSDELVLEAAINGRCDGLVTHDVRHFARGASRFGVRVVTPSECLRELVT